jgi:hypothetical protein
MTIEYPEQRRRAGRGRSSSLGAVLAQCAAATLLAGCEDKPDPSKPRPAAVTSSLETLPVDPPSAPAPPPELSVDSLGVRLGSSRILLDKTEGRQRLTQELASAKAHFTGKPVAMSVERAAKLPWVIEVLEQLGKLGSGPFRIKTDTRKEFPNELEFAPVSEAKNAAACSVVAMVLEDRGTAVWKLSGGVATKRARGFAGPDLTTTGETLQRFGKGCKDSSSLFVSAAEPIEWGLVFDLAASAKSLPGGYFERFVVPAERPTPGHRVEL